MTDRDTKGLDPGGLGDPRDRGSRRGSEGLSSEPSRENQKDQQRYLQIQEGDNLAELLAWMTATGAAAGMGLSIRHFPPHVLERIRTEIAGSEAFIAQKGKETGKNILERIKRTGLGARVFDKNRAKLPEQAMIPGWLTSALGNYDTRDLPLLRDLEVLLQKSRQNVKFGLANANTIQDALLSQFKFDIPQSKGGFRYMQLKDLEPFAQHLGGQSQFIFNKIDDLARLTGLTKSQLLDLNLGRSIMVGTGTNAAHFIRVPTLQRAMFKATKLLEDTKIPLLGFNPFAAIPSALFEPKANFVTMGQRQIRALAAGIGGEVGAMAGRFTEGRLIGGQVWARTGEVMPWRKIAEGYTATTSAKLYRAELAATGVLKRQAAARLPEVLQKKGLAAPATLLQRARRRMVEFGARFGVGTQEAIYPSMAEAAFKKKLPGIGSLTEMTGVTLGSRAARVGMPRLAAGETHFVMKKSRVFKNTLNVFMDTPLRIVESLTGVGIRMGRTPVRTALLGAGIVGGVGYLGYQGVRYLNYKFGDLVGKKPSQMAADIYTGLRLTQKKIYDSVGITALAKSAEEVFPGILDSPLSKAARMFGAPLAGAAFGKAIGGVRGGKWGLLAGAISGALTVNDLAESEEELRELYSGDKMVPVRAGAGWILGRTPYFGGRVKYHVPHWYARQESDYRVKALYGSEANYWKYGTMTPTPENLFGIRPLFNPYWMARQHYYERPYLTTGLPFEETPLFGPVLSQTLGRLIAPPQRMHKGEEYRRLYTHAPLSQGGTALVSSRPAEAGDSRVTVTPPAEAGTTALGPPQAPAEAGGTVVEAVPPTEAGQRAFNTPDDPAEAGYSSYTDTPPAQAGGSEVTATPPAEAGDSRVTTTPPAEAGATTIALARGPLEAGRTAYIPVRAKQVPSGRTSRLQRKTDQDLGLYLKGYGLSRGVPMRPSVPRDIEKLPAGAATKLGLRPLPPYIRLAGEPTGLLPAAGAQFSNVTEYAGFRGFLTQTMAQWATGHETPFSKTAQMASATQIGSAKRAYYDNEIGGLMGLTEGLRRGIPRPRREIEQVNPIQNRMPSWLPGVYSAFEKDRSYFLNFHEGDPYCVAAGSLVEGQGISFVKAEDVVEHNHLTSANGKPTQVTGTAIRQSGPTVRVTVATLPAHPVTVSPDHPYLTRALVKGTGRKAKVELYRQANTLLHEVISGGTRVDMAQRAGISASRATAVWDLLERQHKVRIQRIEQHGTVDLIDPESFPEDLLERGLCFVSAEDLEPGMYVAYPKPKLEETVRIVDLAAMGPWTAVTDSFVYYKAPQEYAENFEFLNGERETPGNESTLWKARQSINKGHSSHRRIRFLELNRGLGRFFGLWCAEGSAADSGSCSTSHHAREKAQVLKMYEDAGIQLTWSTHGNSGTATFGDKGFAYLLRWLCGSGAREKSLAETFFYGPRPFIEGFIDGLFFGDGCEFTSQSRHVRSLKTESWKLALQVRKLLLALGTMASVSECAPGTNSPNPSWVVKIHGDGSDSTNYDWFDDESYYYLRVNSVEADEEQITYGFMTDTATFCVAGVATHNTKIPMGEARLPGPGYEALRGRRIHSGVPGVYDAFDRFKILADVAPWSQSYKHHRAIVQAKFKAGHLSNNEIKQFLNVDQQVQARMEKIPFGESWTAANPERIRISVDEVVSPTSFRSRTFPGAVVQLEGITQSETDIARNLVQNQNELLEARATARDQSRIQRLGEEAHPDGLIDLVKENRRRFHNILKSYEGQELDVFMSKDASQRFERQGTRLNVRAVAPELTAPASELGMTAPDESDLSREVRQGPLLTGLRRAYMGGTRLFGEAGAAVGAAYGALSARKAGGGWRGMLLKGALTGVLGGIIGGGIEQKAIANYTPIEHYRKFNLYGNDFAGWQSPYKNFIRSWWNQGLSKFRSDDWVPGYRQEQRFVEEYFDKLKFVKGSRLQRRAEIAGEADLAKYFARQAKQTMVASSNRDTSLWDRHMRAAIPKKERAYFSEFAKEDSTEVQEQIIKSVPDYMKPIYLNLWKKKLPQGTTFASDVLAEAAEKHMKFRDGLSAEAETVEFFLRNPMPGRDWAGWHPDVSLDNVKLKTVENLGMDMHDFGMWESQARNINPMTPALEGLEPGGLENGRTLMPSEMEEMLGQDMKFGQGAPFRMYRAIGNLTGYSPSDMVVSQQTGYSVAQRNPQIRLSMMHDPMNNTRDYITGFRRMRGRVNMVNAESMVVG